MSYKMKNYYSDEWCRDKQATSQEDLQKIAKMIRSNCKCKEISDMGDYTCTIYVNENLGLRYWVKDEFGHITEINEERAIICGC